MVLVFLAFFPALRAGFIWDDDAYVTGNVLLTMPDGLWRIWFSAHTQSQYFPLVYTTFRLEHALWGLNPLGYHLVNLLLHGANVWLAWMLLRRLRMPGAWLAAAVFALHPVQVETVAWVTELKNTESTLFYLLAVLAWLQFVDSKRPPFYLLALGCQALALFAKTTACTLPAALVLVLWLKSERLNGRRILQVAPFVLMGLAMGLLSIWWEGHLGNYDVESGEEYGWLARVLIATRALWFYAGKVFWPVALTFSYPKWVINTQEPGQYVWLLMCVTAATALWWYRKALGQGVLSGVTFFVATLSPLVGFIWLYTFRYSFVADHYQYLACLGLIAAVIGAASRLTVNWNASLRVSLSVVLLLVLGVLTWRQSLTYKDPETLWQATVARNPDCWMAYEHLGQIFRDKGQFEQAVGHYQKALEIQPADAIAHNNLGEVLVRAGHMDKAMFHFQTALQLKPDYASPHNNVGNILFQMGRTGAALAHYRQALESRPDYPDARNNLGVCLYSIGQVDEALKNWRLVIETSPYYLNAQDNLAWVLATHPDARIRNGGEALKLALRENHLSGGHDPRLLRTLAAAYAENGRFAEAVTTVGQALQLAAERPSLAEALYRQMAAYRSGHPYRTPVQTNQPASHSSPEPSPTSSSGPQFQN